MRNRVAAPSGALRKSVKSADQNFFFIQSDVEIRAEEKPHPQIAQKHAEKMNCKTLTVALRSTSAPLRLRG